MGYIDSHDLSQNEHVLYRAHISWTPLVMSAMITLAVLSLVGGMVWGVTDSLTLGMLVCIAGIIVWGLVKLRVILYNIGVEIVLTDECLHCKEGIVTVKNDREASLGRVDRVDVDMSRLPQRMFDYGDIEFQTVGADGFFYFKKISHPYQLKRAYNDAKERYELEQPGQMPGQDFANQSQQMSSKGASAAHAQRRRHHSGNGKPHHDTSQQQNNGSR